jgi:hypothetical protein
MKARYLSVTGSAITRSDKIGGGTMEKQDNRFNLRFGKANLTAEWAAHNRLAGGLPGPPLQAIGCST